MMMSRYIPIWLAVLAALGTGGCHLAYGTFDYAEDAGDAGEVADAGTDAGTVDAGMVDAGPDAGSDAGGTDAGPEGDAGGDSGTPDAGPDAGPSCVADPDPEGEGSCASTSDCLAHCSNNWATACFFGAYGRPLGEGVCIYRDCRQAVVGVSYEPNTCPRFDMECPANFCFRGLDPFGCAAGQPTECTYSE